MKKLYILPLLVILSACQGATTKRPGVTQAELEAEQRAQSDLVKAQAQQRAENVKVPVTAEMQQRVQAIASRVGAAGTQMCKDLGVSGCNYTFALEEDNILNAYADGKKIAVSSAMVQFADDDELANVLSHEFAHNLMGHVASQQKNAMTGGLLGAALDIGLGSQGLDTGGLFNNLGQQQAVMKYSVGFEQEADYVGLYIMRRAGYAIEKSPNFWRKMSLADPNGIYSQTTHPSNASRYVALNKTIEEIKAKEAAGQPLIPAFKKKK